MPLTVTATGRRKARCLRIVTELPVRLQEKISPSDRQGVKPITINFGSGVLKLTQLGSGELVIEIDEPP